MEVTITVAITANATMDPLQTTVGVRGMDATILTTIINRIHRIHPIHPTHHIIHHYLDDPSIEKLLEINQVVPISG